MKVKIRAAENNDKPDCLNLLQALSNAAGGTIDEDAGNVFDALLGQERGAIVVAIDGNQTVGMAAVSFNLAMRYGGEYCQLEELIVDPATRGKNVGAALVKATIDLATQRGCQEYGLYLVASTEKNWPFYQRFGFDKVGSELRMRL